MMQTHFPPEERLAILKAADSARKKYSVDVKRVCVIRAASSGRQIDIQSDRKGRYWFLCEVSPARYRESVDRDQPEYSLF
jgi:hypothetical protein